MAVDVSGAVSAIDDAAVAVASLGIGVCLVYVGAVVYSWCAGAIGAFQSRRRYRGGFYDL